MTQQHPAGWYGQPDGTQRYWDGSQWMNPVQPPPAPTAPPPQPAASEPKKAWFAKKRVIIPAAALVAIVGWASVQGKGGETATPAAVVATPAHQDSTVEATQEPAEEVTEEATEEAAPSLTVSQEQAVRKAEDYIGYTAFSRSGLIKQLKYEGFSSRDATFGADHIDVDWMEQAAIKAKDYLEYTAFSRSGLIKQLEFEGFTRKQAEHGAKAAGL